MSGVSSFFTRLFLEPLLRKSDDTAIRHRKYVVAAWFSVSVPELLYGICLAPFHDRAMLMMILCFLYGIIAGVLYLILRIRRKCELWFLALGWLFFMQANFLQSSWFHNRAIHCTTVQAILSTSLVIARPPRWFLIVCVSLSVSLASIFIIGEHYDFGLFNILPDAGQYRSVPTPLSLVAASLTIFWLLVLVGTVYAVVNLLDHEESKAELTIKVAKAAALGLSLYDTDAVKEMLNRYEEDDDSDLEMKNVIMSICENMEKYKSYLPNWLINTEENDFMFESEDDEDGEMVTPSGTENQQTGSKVDSPQQQPFLTPKTRSRRDLDKAAIFKILESSSHDLKRSQKPENSDATSSSGSVNPLSAVEVVDIDDALPTPLQRFASRGGITPANHFFGKITLASLDFDLTCVGGGSGAIQVSLNHFVETLTDLVSAAHGALHSISGDVAQISWNAVQRVAQPENKALRVVNLLRENERFVASNVRVSGAISTGDAKCFDAGWKVHSTVVSPAGWKEAHWEMLQIAKKYQTFVCDAATFEQAKYHHEMAAVEHVELSSTKHRSPPTSGLDGKWRLQLQPVILYEIIRDVHSSGAGAHPEKKNDSEWMYQLQETENASIASKISRVLDSMVFPTTSPKASSPPAHELFHETEIKVRGLLRDNKEFFETNPLCLRFVAKVLRLISSEPQSSDPFEVSFKQSWLSIIGEDDS